MLVFLDLLLFATFIKQKIKISMTLKQHYKIRIQEHDKVR